MALNHDKKLIFVHIPKTAGTSIYKALGFFDGRGLIGHRPIEEYKENYGEYWNRYLKFAVVREPIDRFISAYKFARTYENFWNSADPESHLPKHKHYELCNECDINGYVNYLYENPGSHHIATLPQSWFVKNKSGEIEVDYIAKYENLDSDLKKIGIDNIEKLNVSEPIRDESILKLTRRSKNILHEIYESDYDLFYKENILSYS